MHLCLAIADFSNLFYVNFFIEGRKGKNEYCLQGYEVAQLRWRKEMTTAETLAYLLIAPAISPGVLGMRSTAPLLLGGETLEDVYTPQLSHYCCFTKRISTHYSSTSTKPPLNVL